MRNVLLIVCALILSVSCTNKSTKSDVKKDTLSVDKNITEKVSNEIAPSFTIPDKDGNNISLSDFRGKYVLLDFWASWCAPCRKANPKLMEIYNKYKGDNFEIIGISMDDNKKSWLSAVEKDGVTWPQVSSLKGMTADPTAISYSVKSIPHAVLIGPDGTLIATYVNPDEAEQKIIELFK